jgi:hypothetical protein
VPVPTGLFVDVVTLIDARLGVHETALIHEQTTWHNHLLRTRTRTRLRPARGTWRTWTSTVLPGKRYVATLRPAWENVHVPDYQKDQKVDLPYSRRAALWLLGLTPLGSG